MSYLTPSSGILRLIARFMPFALAIWPRAMLVAVFVLVDPLLGVALLWLTKELIDQVFIAQRIDLLPFMAAGYIGLVTANALMNYAMSRIEAGVIERIVQDVRASLYRHLIGVSPGSLGKYSTGDLLAHLSGDVERVELLVFSGPLSVVANIASALFFAVFLLLLSWPLTLCALLAAPVLAWLSFYVSPRIRRASKISRRKATAWLSLAEERLGAVPLVHAFNAEESESSAFQARVAAARRAELRTVSIQAWLSLLIEMSAASVGLLVLVVGAYQTHSGAVTVGALVAFLGSVGSLYSPIRSLANASSRFQRSAAGAQRVADLLDTPSLVIERPAARPLTRVRGALEFRNVRFAYQGGPEVIRDVSFRIEPGETVAVVGSNGSGKSTLIRLALRLVDCTNGAVLIDGQDSREITLQSLRRAVSAVFQEPHILRGSIADNIRYGNPAVSGDDFLKAAQVARVDGFAETMRNGYESAVGSQGGRLSGGQRQRIALARALVREAPILLLDEATASVDSESEGLIQDSLERLAGHRTILLVAHRLSSVRRADRVIVLENGVVVESGTPAELLGPQTRYRNLFASQLVLEAAQ
jgi:ABC-type multidrug transport system fused ATPase/permease subunit